MLHISAAGNIRLVQADLCCAEELKYDLCYHLQSIIQHNNTALRSLRCVALLCNRYGGFYEDLLNLPT